MPYRAFRNTRRVAQQMSQGRRRMNTYRRFEGRHPVKVTLEPAQQPAESPSEGNAPKLTPDGKDKQEREEVT